MKKIFATAYVILLSGLLYGSEGLTVAVIHAQDELGRFQANLEQRVNQLAVNDGVDLRLHDIFLSLSDSGENSRYSILEYLQVQLENLSPDVVVAMLPAAISFMAEASPHIGSEFPLLYAVAPMTFRPPSSAVRAKSFFSTATAISAEKTLELMRELLPERDRLVVISGAHPSDQAYLEMLKPIVAQGALFDGVEYLIGIPEKDLLERIASLDERNAILVSSYSTDSNGTPYVLADIIGNWSSASSAPIFGFYDAIIDTGIVGGYVTRVDAYAEEMYRQLLILAGETRGSLNPSAHELGLVLNRAELGRWKIDTRRAAPYLAEAIVLEAEDGTLTPSVYIGLAVLALGVITIPVMLISQSSRREAKIRRELKDARVYIAESNHRVKNSFQLIQSYIQIKYLSSGKSGDGEMLHELVSKLGIFGRFHSELAVNSADGCAPAIDFLEKFSRDMEAYGRSLIPDISFNYRVDEICLTPQQMLNTSFILSELLTNSLKYAFPAEYPGEKTIELTIEDKPGAAVIQYRDSGVGISKEAQNESGGTGRAIIRGLLSQVDGDLEESYESGYQVRITFPVPPDSER